MALSQQKVDQIKASLSYQRPSIEDQEKIEKIREATKRYVEEVAQLVDENRDTSLWVTHLEEAQQRLIRSIVVPQGGIR